MAIEGMKKSNVPFDEADLAGIILNMVQVIWVNQEDTGFGGKRGETIGGSQNVPQCELRSFLVNGKVEKINDVLYKLLRLVRSFLVIGKEEKIICTVWYPLD
jgi:hypothetical protein